MIKITTIPPPGWRPGSPLPATAATVTVVKPARSIHDKAWVVWDDLCQTVRAQGFREVVRLVASSGQSQYESAAIQTERGGIRQLTAAERKKLSDAVAAETE